MGNSRRIAILARAPRLLLLALLGAWLLCAGGCAVMPFALTGASLAVPQMASLAMSGAKAAHKVGFVAADERDPATILRDNMLALNGQSALLGDAASSDVHVYAYTGDLFVVGLVDAPADRDRIVRTLRAVRGVDEVKGLLRLRSDPRPFTRMGDTALQNYVRMAVGSHLLHKNGQVEIDAVGGELCLMGVVGTHAEALDLIQYVESITGARANSLLAIRDEFASGLPDTNRRYLLTCADDPAPRVQAAPSLALPETPVAYTLAAAVQAHPGNEQNPAQRAVWNKTRLRLGERIAAMAKREHSAQARAELMTLAGQVTTDRDLSITDRLSVAAAQARDPRAQSAIKALLAVH